MSKTRTVYSTDPDFNLRKENEKRPGSTLPAEKQTLRISLDRKQRKGKAVTLIDGFVGNEEALRALGKELKSKCGVGGTVKNGQILVQGDFREKVMAILQSGGYRTKRVGG
jgi:translation initiation factor 1